MPYASKRQARWTHATGQPFARRWDKLTRFRGLPEHKDAGADAGTPLHGPGGLLATPGLGSRRKERPSTRSGQRKGRKWGMRTKDVNYGARAGQTIRGNLGRSASGQFTRVGGPAGTAPLRNDFKKPITGAKKPRKARARKPRQTDAQRQEARQAKRQQNTADVAKRMAASDTGLSPSGVKALTAFAGGTQPDAQAGAGLAKMGLAEQAADGSYRMTATGRAAVAAMAAGDYQRTVDAISRGTDTSGKREQRQQERTSRQQAQAQKRQEAEAKRQARREQVAARRAEAAKRKKKKQMSKKPAKADETAANRARNLVRLSPEARAAISHKATGSPGDYMDAWMEEWVTGI